MLLKFHGRSLNLRHRTGAKLGYSNDKAVTLMAIRQLWAAGVEIVSSFILSKK